jgi:hypothetical protein
VAFDDDPPHRRPFGGGAGVASGPRTGRLSAHPCHVPRPSVPNSPYTVSFRPRPALSTPFPRSQPSPGRSVTRVLPSSRRLR